jgi:hypothetical protein
VSGIECYNTVCHSRPEANQPVLMKRATGGEPSIDIEMVKLTLLRQLYQPARLGALSCGGPFSWRKTTSARAGRATTTTALNRVDADRPDAGVLKSHERPRVPVADRHERLNRVALRRRRRPAAGDRPADRMHDRDIVADEPAPWQVPCTCPAAPSRP